MLFKKKRKKCWNVIKKFHLKCFIQLEIFHRILIIFTAFRLIFLIFSFLFRRLRLGKKIWILIRIQQISSNIVTSIEKDCNLNSKINRFKTNWKIRLPEFWELKQNLNSLILKSSFKLSQTFDDLGSFPQAFFFFFFTLIKEKNGIFRSFISIFTFVF